MSLIGKLKDYRAIVRRAIRPLMYKPVENANVEVMMFDVPEGYLAIDDIIDTLGARQRLIYPYFLEMRANDYFQAANYILENHQDEVKYVAVKTEEDSEWTKVYENISLRLYGVRHYIPPHT